jgi:hypothetical protein
LSHFVSPPLHTLKTCPRLANIIGRSCGDAVDQCCLPERTGLLAVFSGVGSWIVGLDRIVS